MTAIIQKVRDLIEDNYRYFNGDTFEYTGTSKIFNLSESNIDSISIVVEKNGAVWAASNYSYSSTTGKLTVTGTLLSGDVLVVSYNYYLKYSDFEVRGHIRSALYWLTTEKYKTFTAKSDNIIYPTPAESEECLIAIVASILITGSVRSYRTPEFSINYDESISKDEKIKRAVAQFKKTFGVLGY